MQSRIWNVVALVCLRLSMKVVTIISPSRCTLYPAILALIHISAALTANAHVNANWRTCFVQAGGSLVFLCIKSDSFPRTTSKTYKTLSRAECSACTWGLSSTKDQVCGPTSIPLKVSRRYLGSPWYFKVPPTSIPLRAFSLSSAL
jgi:hypothetical protein